MFALVIVGIFRIFVCVFVCSTLHQSWRHSPLFGNTGVPARTGVHRTLEKSQYLGWHLHADTSLIGVDVDLYSG